VNLCAHSCWHWHLQELLTLGQAPVEIDLASTGVAATPGAQWTYASYAILLEGLALSIGDVLQIGWAFGDGTGSGVRDEIAFDDITLRAVQSVRSVPEPALLGMLLAACSSIAFGFGTQRRARPGRTTLRVARSAANLHCDA
jgi:hypothetical protein